MNIKPRIEPAEQKILQHLKGRMVLSAKELKYYLNLEKGFEGEQRFDLLIDQLSDHFLILSDLLLELNNTIFQIDSLLITRDTIYFFEVKNYEGDYYIKHDNWYTTSDKEIKNPLLQLKRSESLLRRLLQDLGYHFQIESYLTLVNPDFYLYQSPINLPIIFPTQINRFLKKINLNSGKLTDKHSKLANKLLSIHLKESPYALKPSYSYDQLEKGICCAFCQSLELRVEGNLIICTKCWKREKITTAVLRSIEEYRLLFPDREITTNGIYDWCKIINSKKTIRRILNSKFSRMGHGVSTYYIDSNNE